MDSSKEYKVVISLIKKGNKKYLTGLLNVIDNETLEINNYTFCPESILCDLSIFDYDTSSIDKYNKNEFIDELVITSYKTEKAFNNILISKSEDTFYYSLCQLIKKQILNGYLFSASEIDKLKIYFDIDFKYSISYKKRNKEEFIPLEYGKYNFNDFNDKDIKKLDSKYIYECKNLTGVIFTILHYLIINGYNRVKTCKHCERLFFYNNAKSNYCFRSSIYPGYEHLDCEQAVRNIQQEISRHHKKIYNDYYGFKLGKYVGGTGGNFSKEFNDYLDNYYNLKDKIKDLPSISNLKKMNNYLLKYLNKKN